MNQSIQGDWLLRFSNGLTRRANSVNPLREPATDLDVAIATCESLYRERNLPAIFRLPSFIGPATERRLDRLGYVPGGETVARYADISELPANESPEVELAPRPEADWLAATASLQRHTPEQNAIYTQIVSLIDAPAMFAAVRHEGCAVALAYGVVHDRLLCLNSVATFPDHRGRGHGSRMLSALAGWAKRNGAEGACLPVEASNSLGQALYDSFGLRREVYRYHYRREPDVA